MLYKIYYRLTPVNTLRQNFLAERLELTKTPIKLGFFVRRFFFRPAVFLAGSPCLAGNFRVRLESPQPLGWLVPDVLGQHVRRVGGRRLTGNLSLSFDRGNYIVGESAVK